MALHHNWEDDSYNEQESKPVENKPIRWSKSEPKVTECDIIMRIEKDPLKVLEEMRVSRIDENGEIWGRMLINDMNKDPHQGAEYKWEGEYVKLNY